jgi:hypothetical protein
MHRRLQQVVEQQAGFAPVLSDWLVRATVLALAQTALLTGIGTEDMVDQDQGYAGTATSPEPGEPGPSIGIAGPAGVVLMKLRSLERASLSEIASRRGQAERHLAEAQHTPSDRSEPAVMVYDLSQSRIDSLFVDPQPRQRVVLALGRIPIPGLDRESASSDRWQASLTMTCDRWVIGKAVAQELLNTLVDCLEEPFLLLA